MKKASMKVLAVIAAASFLGLASSMDYEDAVNADRHYCTMVAEGLWPAYRDDIVCSKVEGE